MRFVKRVKDSPNKKKPIDFARSSRVFFLSTGRCGTAFFAYLFSRLPNTKGDHEQPKLHGLGCQSVNLANIWMTDYARFKALTSNTLEQIDIDNQFKLTKGKESTFNDLLKSLEFDSAFDFHFITNNSLFGFTKLLREEGFTLIHLIRHPFTWCESELSKCPSGHAAMRPETFFKEDANTPAQHAAYAWLYTNKLIYKELQGYQHQCGLPMESLDVKGIMKLIDFVGVPQEAVEAMTPTLHEVIDTRDKIRSPHYGKTRFISNRHNTSKRGGDRIILSAEDRKAITKIVGEFASHIGYHL